LCVFIKALKFLVVNIWFSFVPLLDWKKRYGEDSWVVVTGATDGIGWQMCQDIAKKGLNVVLISRTVKKLEDRCATLTQMFPNIKNMFISFDFSNQNDAESYRQIGKKLEHLDVSVLINNVGCFSTKIARASTDDLRNCIIVNTLAQCLLTKVFLERFLTREKRSGIIMVCSLGGKVTTNIQAPYHATKAIGGNFTIGEADLYPGKIDCCTLYPGYVVTNMVAARKKDLVTCTVSDFSGAALRLLGRKNATFGYYKHQLFGGGLAVAKWFLGWKQVLFIGFGSLRLVQKLQYKVNPPKVREDMNKEERRADRANRRQDAEDSRTKWSLFKSYTIKSASKVKAAGQKLYSQLSFSSQESDVSSAISTQDAPKFNSANSKKTFSEMKKEKFD